MLSTNSLTVDYTKIRNLPYTTYPCDTTHPLHCPQDLFVYCFGSCRDSILRFDPSLANCQDQD